MSENTTETATHDVILTDVAAQKVKSLLEQEGRDDLRLRVAVQPGGCSGLIYRCTSTIVCSMVTLSVISMALRLLSIA